MNRHSKRNEVLKHGPGTSCPGARRVQSRLFHSLSREGFAGRSWHERVHYGNRHRSPAPLRVDVRSVPAYRVQATLLARKRAEPPAMPPSSILSPGEDVMLALGDWYGSISVTRPCMGLSFVHPSPYRRTAPGMLVLRRAFPAAKPGDSRHALR